MERPDPATKFPPLDELRAILAENIPFCSGTFELPPQAFELYYGREDAKFVDFAKSASNVQALCELAEACEPAKFGRGTKTVLDETYRKAWKMDPENFKTGLDVDECGLLDVVQTGLLPKHQVRNFRAELYKLNVYGKGAFFKPHQDTPRGEDMFGSLVVIMPTPHEGGELVLRHDGEEWTFDAAKLLSERGSNSLAYIAFFSDVEHEVLPVTSGHRVTLTYNLFYTWDRCTRLHREGVSAVSPAHADVKKIERVLSGLLADREFLPSGGTLGFGLRHTYPFPNLWKDGMEDPLESLERWLKGSDHSLYQACEALGLEPHLRLVHRGYRYTVLMEFMVELPEDLEDELPADYSIVHDYGGVVVKPLDLQAVKPEDDSDDQSSTSDGDTETLEVYWVTDWYPSNSASIDHIYARVCLIASVSPAVARFQSTSDEGQANKGQTADGDQVGEGEGKDSDRGTPLSAPGGLEEEFGDVVEPKGGDESEDSASKEAT